MASLRRVMLNVSNQPKAGGRQGEWPRQRKGLSCAQASSQKEHSGFQELK